MNIFKNNAVKTIKTGAKIIAIITVKNKVMQNALTCRITSIYKENEYENMQNISNVFLDILKKFSTDVRFWKVEGNYT